MEYFDFEVLKGDETIAVARSVGLSDASAAWPKIAEVVKDVDEPGCRVMVTDEAGEVVILVGIAVARHLTVDLRQEGQPVLHADAR